MINTKKIKGKIAENGYTRETLASALGMSRTTLRKKINGVSKLTGEEIMKFSKVLHISENELMVYFFYDESSQNENFVREEGA